ncbi:MAG: hypothetical protein HYU76_07315 [Betaproteobacteria bacterium]|nr:hypothetical protein [Betaproteobacteria bacterium]
MNRQDAKDAKKPKSKNENEKQKTSALILVHQRSFPAEWFLDFSAIFAAKICIASLGALAVHND